MISPFAGGYESKVASFLDDMRKKDGFDVDKSCFSNSGAAQTIAFYGYTFIMSVEKTWNESTEEQLKNVDYVVDSIRKYMLEYLKKAKRG